MRYMLAGLQCTSNTKLEPGCQVALGLKRPPEVLVANANLTAIISVDNNEETDGAFAVIAAWGRVVALTGDTSLEDQHYALLKQYTNYYLEPAYFNHTLSLLYTDVLEHSRLGVFWSAFDILTNSFAVEGIRCMIAAAGRQNDTEEAAVWTAARDKLLAGIHANLSYVGMETDGQQIYAELRGHPQLPGARGFPLLWGMSWVNKAVVTTMLANLSSAGSSVPPVPVSELGLLPSRIDATYATYGRSASFLWLTDDIEMSALVHTTNTNSSRLRNPSYVTGPPPPPPPPPPPACSKILYGKSALWLASGGDLCTAMCGKVDAQCQYASSNCSLPPTPAQCCRACEASDNCGSWFLNGDTKICYAKVPGATNDTVTKPSVNFSAVRSSELCITHARVRVSHTYDT